LRAGLSNTGKKERAVRFKVEPWACQFKPGIDRDKLGQLLDQLDTEEFIRKMSR
jgi:hypothetical protein